MPFQHIMLDMETLSSREDAVILSIGAVRFDLETLQIAGKDFEFYQVVNPKDCHQRGLRIDYDTVLWWMKQSVDAQSVFGAEGILLPDALMKFKYYVESFPLTSTVWGNGATFDNMIMRNAFRACDMTYPVTYRDDLCFRTIKRMFNYLNPIAGYAGTKHNALDDARWQAQILVDIFSKLRTRGAR